MQIVRFKKARPRSLGHPTNLSIRFTIFEEAISLKPIKRWRVMEYIYAAMLLHKAGKPIDEENVTKVLETAGINVDPVRVKALVAAISAVDIEEVLKSASSFTAAPAAVAPAPSVEEKPAEEEKKEEEEEEKKEEEALEGLGALFG